jgi:Aldo/keto reductase family
VKKYLNERGFGILGALDQVAKTHGSTPTRVALAWLLAKLSVTAPIASVTNLDQLHETRAFDMTGARHIAGRTTSAPILQSTARDSVLDKKQKAGDLTPGPNCATFFSSGHRRTHGTVRSPETG